MEAKLTPIAVSIAVFISRCLVVEAGVASLKIEGRMKSPEYVQAVTAAYRAVLDRTLAAKDEGGRASVHATAEERRSLEEAFSRGFTTAYLEGARGNDVMSYQRPNNRGAFVGRVADVRKEMCIRDSTMTMAPVRWHGRSPCRRTPASRASSCRSGPKRWWRWRTAWGSRPT